MERCFPARGPMSFFEYEVENILNPGKAKPPAVAKKKALPPLPAVIDFGDLSGRPSRGPASAEVTLIEVSDFHCPFCKRALPTVDKILEEYEGKVRLVWWHFPLSFHKGADRTHEASECAAAQGKFWEFHDQLFETMGASRNDAALIQMAGELGIDKGKFKSCLESGQFKERVAADLKKASEYRVGATPTFFVNGRRVVGAQPFERFKTIIDKELSKS